MQKKVINGGMEFRERPVVILATQWFKNGDHPQDGTERFLDGEYKGELYEGKVVRYFRFPLINGESPCPECGKPYHVHGWIDALENSHRDGHRVCPGDWIITGVHGEHYPCKPDIFAKTYEKVEE